MVNTIGWAVSSVLATDVLYDLFGALAHVVTVVISIIASPYNSSRNLIAAALVFLWATRLGVHLFTRAIASGGDKRLEKYKTKPARFAILWFMQALWVLFNTLPLLLNNAFHGEASGSLAFYDQLALAAWATGFVIEVVADEQKRAFRAVPANKGRFITTGLWKYSRHPNYFGEILMWVSFALFCAPPMLASGPTLQALSLLSPGFTIWLLLRVSGVPLLERAGKDKWGDDDRYRLYIQQTSLLIPMPPKALK